MKDTDVDYCVKAGGIACALHDTAIAPCPRCGAEGVMWNSCFNGIFVECKREEGSVRTDYYESPEAAIRAWNSGRLA